MISQVATIPSRPTEAQKRWLADVFGPELWDELSRHGEFVRALETSVDSARRIALRHLAQKEVYRRSSCID